DAARKRSGRDAGLVQGGGMAAVLKNETAFWPVDKLILAYFAFAMVAIGVAWNHLAEAPWLVATHIVGAAALIYEVRRPNPTSWIFRHWYPLLYVAWCYKEMALLIPALRRTDADQWLANLDYRVRGVYPAFVSRAIHDAGGNGIFAGFLYPFFAFVFAPRFYFVEEATVPEF